MELPGVGARTVQKILEDKRLIVESTEVLDGEFALALNEMCIRDSFRMLCICTFTVPAESVSVLAMFWLSFPMSAWRNTSSSRLERS